jgi:DNA repair exonuclease SbcCD nuclease subunit
MLLVHLSDLHLGHRAYERAERGKNVRERDVALAFQRAVDEVIRLKPDLILLVGDIFDRPDPPPGALVALAQGLESIRSAIPSTQVFMVAGARDTPRPLTDPGALAALDPFPNVEAVTGRARSVFLRELETHLFLVPHRAVVRRPYPELRTHPEARWNLLLAYAGVGTGAGPGLPLDPAPWDYVALGYLHQHQQVAPRAYYPGSLERVGPEPWREAAQEKGFLSFDMESGTSRFHPIPGRPVVALAPIRIPRGESSKLSGKVREVLGEVPGGIDGKIVRLRIEGLTPEEVKREDQGLFAELRELTLHLAIEVDDFQSLAEDNPLPLVARDRWFALRALRERIKEEEGGGSDLDALLKEFIDESEGPGDGRGMEEELLVREFHGSGLPFLGEVSMEAEEGLLGWMGGDGRTLRAFANTLLWGVGINSGLPGLPEGEEKESASLALRLGGVREGSFWKRSGRSAVDNAVEGVDGPMGEWGLPVESIALAWCGEGGDSPEEVLAGGEELLAAARGVGELDQVLESLAERYPGLKRERGLGELTARDYERLMLESELADLKSQIRALEDVPRRVAELEAELLELRGSVTEVGGDLGAGTMEWHRERQDAETHLQAYRDRGRELRDRIKKLEELGPDSPCPTCGRLLAEHFLEVLEELRDEWEALVQDGQWWRRRWEQLEGKPEELIKLEGEFHRLNAQFENCTERLERARSSLRELDELRVREREVRDRMDLVLEESTDGGASPEELEVLREGAGEIPETPPMARTLYDLARGIRDEILTGGRTRLTNRAGRRLNRLTGGRILGLESGSVGGPVQLVDGGGSAGVEADEDRAAAVVALRMALVELLAEDWNPLGSFLLGDPFDRMGAEDQLRALSLLRRILSRIPQVFLLTRGSVLERAPEFFDGLFDFRVHPERGRTFLRTLPAGVGLLRVR